MKQKNDFDNTGSVNADLERDMNGRGRSVILRQKKILDLVKGQGFVSIDALSQNFMVTSQTIRRDINELSSRGLVRRYHAGLPSSVENVAYTTRKVSVMPERFRLLDSWRTISQTRHPSL